MFQTVPGVDFMIGEKDTCNVRTNCPSRIFGDVEASFQGDSGGPLWVREEEGGKLPIAYLVWKS